MHSDVHGSAVLERWPRSTSFRLCSFDVSSFWCNTCQTKSQRMAPLVVRRPNSSLRTWSAEHQRNSFKSWISFVLKISFVITEELESRWMRRLFCWIPTGNTELHLGKDDETCRGGLRCNGLKQAACESSWVACPLSLEKLPLAAHVAPMLVAHSTSWRRRGRHVRCRKALAKRSNSVQAFELLKAPHVSMVCGTKMNKEYQKWYYSNSLVVVPVINLGFLSSRCLEGHRNVKQHHERI